MRARAELIHAIGDLLQAQKDSDRQEAAKTIRGLVDGILNSNEIITPANAPEAVERDKQFLDRLNPPLTDFSDDQLAKLNWLLPWAAMTVDPKGRIIGDAWSQKKRASIGRLLEDRLKKFAKVFPFKGKHVLEVGCFEGIHTIGSILLGARVTAVDGRVENILKTMARLWAYGLKANIVLWNLEHAPSKSLPESWDILHHIGVLYHLSNPVEHLDVVLPRTQGAVILDTHIAADDASATAKYDVNGRSYAYYNYVEPEVATSPFSGLLDHSKWLRLDDLKDIFARHGFKDIQVVRDDIETNGRRITLWAFK